MAQPARNADALPRLFGYAALERHYGWRRRTIENAMRKGLLCRPAYYGKRAYWTAEQVDDYLRRLRDDRARVAVSAPDDIAPERIEDAFDVLAERWAEKRGVDLPPGSYVSINTPLTADQAAQHASAAADDSQKAAQALAEAFARLDPVRVWLVVGGMIPALRPAADAFLKNMTGLAPSETQDELRALALDILDQAIGGEFVGPSIEKADTEGAL